MFLYTIGIILLLISLYKFIQYNTLGEDSNHVLKKHNISTDGWLSFVGGVGLVLTQWFYGG